MSIDRKASFVFVGDLNTPHVECLDLACATDRHGTAACDLSDMYGCEIDYCFLHVFQVNMYLVLIFPFFKRKGLITEIKQGTLFVAFYA